MITHNKQVRKRMRPAIFFATACLAVCSHAFSGAYRGEEIDEPSWTMEKGEFPTPEGVESYRAMLEARLLERYNNLPDYAGKVAKVSVVLSRPLDASLDGKFIKAEFDQLVYDNWGLRIPELEKEYYVVTFGAGGVEQVRSDPSVRVGLDLEKVYSERAPLAGDPFRNVGDDEAFGKQPRARMPEWWRPGYNY